VFESDETKCSLFFEGLRFRTFDCRMYRNKIISLQWPNDLKKITHRELQTVSCQIIILSNCDLAVVESCLLHVHVLMYDSILYY
jgi:hypothetical protein